MTTRFKTAADFKKSLENRLKNMALEKGENLQRLRRSDFGHISAVRARPVPQIQCCAAR